MSTPGDIRSLEEAALAGMPSLCLDVYDGWLVRTAQGHSRRANSVTPLYASSLDVDQKIDYCEALYAAAGLPTTFKMSPVSSPVDLDERLAQRGYRRDTETLVCTRAIEVDAGSRNDRIEIGSSPEGEWLHTWGRLSQRSSEGGIFARLLAATPTPAAYALARHEGAGIACGRATISAGVAGLYDLAVDDPHRRQGLATDLTLARLAWAGSHGASLAMLQVVANNDAARSLQERLGFVEAYRYWYRVQA